MVMQGSSCPGDSRKPRTVTQSDDLLQCSNEIGVEPRFAKHHRRTDLPGPFAAVTAWKVEQGDHWRMIVGEKPTEGVEPFGLCIVQLCTFPYPARDANTFGIDTPWPPPDRVETFGAQHVGQRIRRFPAPWSRS